MATHCRQGHPYDAANTYVSPHGVRHCRTCKRAAGRRRDHWKGQGPASQRTHCPHGHAYDAANTYVSPAGARHCRACRTSTRKAVALAAAMARAECEWYTRTGRRWGSRLSLSQ